MVNSDNQHILTNDKIVKVIIDYVEEDLYKYAVLIDGEWGCGKTYFIKEYLCEKLEEHENNKSEPSYKPKKIVYVSLYGVKSVDEVSKQILMESYLSNTSKTKGILKKGAHIIFPIAFDFMKEKGLDSISSVAEDLLPTKNSILIFDDLERCDCPINEILGYINTFVEHEGMKVIIVANQKEIGKNMYMINPELKYLVAAHKNIVFEEKTREKQIFDVCNEQQIEEQEPVELSLVQSRIEKLFGQNKMYEKVKEKLIGITIYYYPELQKVFSKLINNKSISDDLQKLLLDAIPFFEEYMVSEEHMNIRTFQFFLSKICDLYEAISKLDEKGRKEFFCYIMKYSFRVCVCYKNSTLEYKWEGNEEYGFKDIGKKYFGGGNLAFRFVDDFVRKSILDEKRMKKMFRVYVDEYITPRSNYIEEFKKLENQWSLSTDIEVEQQIERILKDLEENKYEIKDYDRIIRFFIDLEEVGFSESNTEKAILSMKGNIEKLTYHIYLDRGYSFGSNAKKERFKKIMYELQNIIDRHFQKQISKTIEQYFSINDGWAEELVDYVRKNKNEIRNNSGFLSQMNVECLVTKIRDSKAYDIQAFRKCIMELYMRIDIGNALKEDCEKIDKLLVKIEEMDKSKFDKIKTVQIKWLIESLENTKNFLV